MMMKFHFCLNWRFWFWILLARWTFFFLFSISPLSVCESWLQNFCLELLFFLCYSSFEQCCFHWILDSLSFFFFFWFVVLIGWFVYCIAFLSLGIAKPYFNFHIIRRLICFTSKYTILNFILFCLKIAFCFDQLWSHMFHWFSCQIKSNNSLLYFIII